MATIKEVALEAGLSVSCVSKYLNHPSNVLPSTRDKIDVAIKKLGYTPSPLARSLRTKRTNIIIVMVESIINPFFAELYDCIRRELELYGYMTILETFSERRYNSHDFSYADGIIICFPDLDDKIKIICDAAKDIPVVLIHGHKTDDDILTIQLNVGHGSEMAIDYLYNIGCRSFISVGGRQQTSMSNEKLKAIRQYVSGRKGVSLKSYEVENNHKGGKVAVEQMIDCIADIDAIICESDALATGVISRLCEKGIKVPRDIKVVGYDDIPLASMFRPPITTVEVPSSSMSVSACNMLCALIDGEEGQDVLFEPKLIVRETT